jgi:protein-disulfide isomerase
MFMRKSPLIFAGLLLSSLTIACLARAADSGDVPVAKIGSITLTQKQMQDELGMSLYEAQNQVYQMERSWVDQKAKQILFDQAAKETGLTPQELEKKYPVELVLAKPVAPHINVTYSKDDPVLGPTDAPVTLIEFSDFQCPYCKRSQETLKQLESAYKGQIKLVMREYPLSFHDRARPAAEAALCAQEQNPAKFWPYHDKLFTSQTLTDDEFKQFAKEVGLNQKKWEKCVMDKKYDARIEKDIAEGQRFGVRGTPAFFINGFPVSGAQPYQVFDDAVKDVLLKRS